MAPFPPDVRPTHHKADVPSRYYRNSPYHLRRPSAPAAAGGEEQARSVSQMTAFIPTYVPAVTPSIVFSGSSRGTRDGLHRQIAASTTTSIVVRAFDLRRAVREKRAIPARRSRPAEIAPKLRWPSSSAEHRAVADGRYSRPGRVFLYLITDGRHREADRTASQMPSPRGLVRPPGRYVSDREARTGLAS